MIPVHAYYKKDLRFIPKCFLGRDDCQRVRWSSKVFSHFIFLYFIKTVGLAHEYYNTSIKFFRLGVVGRHARVKSGSRCWGSPGLLMFVTSTSANTRWVFCFKIPAVEGKMVSEQTCPPLDSRSATQFGSGSLLSWLFSTLGGISTAYLPRREILV